MKDFNEYSWYSGKFFKILIFNHGSTVHATLSRNTDQIARNSEGSYYTKEPEYCMDVYIGTGAL